MPKQSIRELERAKGDLHSIIPSEVNTYGQSEAGRRLGVHSSTLSRWLKAHGYRMKVVFIRESGVQQ